MTKCDFSLKKDILAPFRVSPVAESVHSALVSAVSKAEMSDLTVSVAPKSIHAFL